MSIPMGVCFFLRLRRYPFWGSFTGHQENLSLFFGGGVPLKKTPTLPVHSSMFLVVVFGQAVSLARREREADQREAGDAASEQFRPGRDGNHQPLPFA